MTESKHIVHLSKNSIPLICNSIQRIGEFNFALFLQVLDDKWGNFIHMCSTHMSCLLDICYNPNLTGKFSLEEVDGCMVRLVLYDSSDLVKLLEVKWQQMGVGRLILFHGCLSGFPCVYTRIVMLSHATKFTPLYNRLSLHSWRTSSEGSVIYLTADSCHFICFGIG